MADPNAPVTGPNSNWVQSGGTETGGGAATGRPMRRGKKTTPDVAPTSSAPASTEKPTHNDDLTGIPDLNYNPLQRYRNMTYNTRLTMMPAVEKTMTRADRTYDYTKGIIMWETGGTGTIFLENLDMKVYPPGNVTANYASAVSGIFTGRLVEPVGGRFIEALSVAAVSLDYRNNAQAIYLLEISFTGYDENDIPVTCKGWDDEELTFRWYVQMQELKMKLDYKGSTYEFNMTTDAGIGTQADFYSLEQGFRMKGSPSTIGQFCTELAEALNEREKDKVSAGLRCYPHKYVITPHKDIANLKYSNSFFSRQNWSWLIGRGEVQAQPGTSIQQFIMNSVSQSEEMYKHLHRVNDGKKEYNSPDTKKGTIDKPAYNISILHGVKAIKDGESPQFDHKINSYVFEVHYFIFTKPDAKNVISPVEYEDAFEPAQRDARVNLWLKLGMLRKAYKWIHTGENTEVINADIKLDNLWRYVRPLWIDNETGKPVSSMSTQKTAQTKGGNGAGAPLTCDEAKKVTQQPILKKGDQLYAEDMPYRDGAQNNPDINPHKGWYPHMPQFYHMNTAVNQQTSQSSFMQESAQEYSIYRQINNAQGQGANDHFNMNLEVIGDPYWLMQIPDKQGTPPWEDDIWDWEKNHWSQEQLAEKRKKCATHNWLPFLYFEAQAPAADWTPDDLMNLRKLDSVTGIFGIKSINNKFVKGKFTSHLECIRDNLSNPWNARKGEKTSNNKESGASSGKSNTASSTGPNNAAPAVEDPGTPTRPSRGPNAEYTNAEATQEANRLNRIQQQRLASGQSTTVTPTRQ